MMDMDKKGIVSEYVVYWIIGIALLILVLFIYGILHSKGISAIEYIKNLLRFGG